LATTLGLTTMLEPGEAAPDFELRNQDGEPVALSDYRGQPVVVYFYPRADTPGCTTQACSFRDNWDAYEERGVAVLGISDDSVEDLVDFAEKYDLPVELLSDEDGSVASAYDSYGEKNVFGNEVTGVFRNTYVVDADGRIAAAYAGVDPEGHAEKLLADLDAIGE
jgi:peroxiredoxin Q/BCP